MNSTKNIKIASEVCVNFMCKNTFLIFFTFLYKQAISGKNRNSKAGRRIRISSAAAISEKKEQI